MNGPPLAFTLNSLSYAFCHCFVLACCAVALTRSMAGSTFFAIDPMPPLSSQPYLTIEDSYGFPTELL